MGKGKSSTLVEGMGVGMHLLQELSNRLKVKTGTDEALHFLVKKRFEANLDAVVDAIAACDWRIPASELRDLAEQWYQEDFGEEMSSAEMEAWRNLEWTHPLTNLGITFESFHDSPSWGSRGVPSIFREQLHSRVVSYPIKVYTGRKDMDFYNEFIVIGLSLKGDNNRPFPGERIDQANIVGFSIVEAKYIDFDR